MLLLCCVLLCLFSRLNSILHFHLFDISMQSFTGTSRSQFSEHLEGHFEHKCDQCDYTSRTEGRLKQHILKFHKLDDDNQDGRLLVCLNVQCKFTNTRVWWLMQRYLSHLLLQTSAKKMAQVQIARCSAVKMVVQLVHHPPQQIELRAETKSIDVNNVNSQQQLRYV